MEEVEKILKAIEDGDTEAAEDLLPLVYEELRKLASHKMANERAGHTLQPTALVHEAYLHLMKGDGRSRQWQNREHFFAASAEAMRRILVDSVRRKLSLKRGGDRVRETWDETGFSVEAPPGEILAVHEVVDRLKKEHPDLARVVLLRYFGGMTVEETASALEVSPSTVERQWRAARAWLRREISEML